MNAAVESLICRTITSNIVRKMFHLQGVSLQPRILFGDHVDIVAHGLCRSWLFLDCPFTSVFDVKLGMYCHGVCHEAPPIRAELRS